MMMSYIHTAATPRGGMGFTSIKQAHFQNAKKKSCCGSPRQKLRTGMSIPPARAASGTTAYPTQQIVLSPPCRMCCHLFV